MLQKPPLARSSGIFHSLCQEGLSSGVIGEEQRLGAQDQRGRRSGGAGACWEAGGRAFP